MDRSSLGSVGAGLSQILTGRYPTYAVGVKAQTALERALGLTLENHNVAVDSAYRGRVAQPPSAVPLNPPRSR